MTFPPLDPTGVRILVTNDDGINAPGLDALTQIAHALSDDVWIVAPEANQSGAGHSLSLSNPIRAREINERKFAIEGTPTDCVLFGVRHLLRGREPTLVLSGVNRGANMADDVTYSGTIAGAMEGCLLGFRSIAMSQVYTAPHPLKWSTAIHHGPDVIRKVLSVEWPRECLLNVNFPDVVSSSVTGVVATRQGKRGFGGGVEERADPRGGAYYWIVYRPDEPLTTEGNDIGAVRAGAVSVTPLHLDLTHESMRRRLRDAFGHE